jgi:CheY-like chemotaxis protein
MNNLYQTLQYKAAEKSISFTVSTDPSVPLYVGGDPVRLSQMLINLTGNSIKFTQNGFVSVRCKHLLKNDLLKFYNNPDFDFTKYINSIFIYFEIKDTGIGIAEDKIEKIFESFSQASADITRKFGGTGLGLTITKKLIELQNGKLKVESEPGKGSVFSFVLPYQVSDQTVLQIKPAHELSIIADELNRIKILLVEDNIFNQIVAVDSLKNEIAEIEIDVASNGQEALDKLKLKPYAIVLMDVQMPVMDGLETTRRIRTTFSSPLNKTPILAMTAGALKSEIDLCMEAGMNDFITKPFNLADLITKIHKYTNLKKTTNEKTT